MADKTISCFLVICSLGFVASLKAPNLLKVEFVRDSLAGVEAFANGPSRELEGNTIRELHIGDVEESYEYFTQFEEETLKTISDRFIRLGSFVEVLLRTFEPSYASIRNDDNWAVLGSNYLLILVDEYRRVRDLKLNRSTSGGKHVDDLLRGTKLGDLVEYLIDPSLEMSMELSGKLLKDAQAQYDEITKCDLPDPMDPMDAFAKIETYARYMGLFPIRIFRFLLDPIAIYNSQQLDNLTGARLKFLNILRRHGYSIMDNNILPAESAKSREVIDSRILKIMDNREMELET